MKNNTLLKKYIAQETDESLIEELKLALEAERNEYIGNNRIKYSIYREEEALLPEVTDFENIDFIKETYRIRLWKKVNDKTKMAYRIVIGKPSMPIESVSNQVDLYRKKYEDAKDGLDVFKGQADSIGISQEEYRELVIEKGDAFLQYEKKINDIIEMTRSIMEDRINAIDSIEDVERIEVLFLEADGFTFMTPIEEILEKLS